jgi:uncharacterized damage-inducible protein DinB
MNLLVHVQLMATYNQEMNQKVYAVCGGLSQTQLEADRGAFFHSVIGTLNHLMVADVVWLKRFAEHPAAFEALTIVRSMERPRSLDQILYTDFDALRQARQDLDQVILDWVNGLQAPDLDLVLDYQNMKGVPARRSLGLLLCHLFNHQTHHRGQVTTLLAQESLDVGVTDLLDWIPQV